MKIIVGDFIKSFSPATATTEIKVVELEENEKFDENTVKNIGAQIHSRYQWMFNIMNFDGHQTFKLVMNFVYNNQKISVARFPVFTQNL